MADLKRLSEEIEGLTLLEAQELKTILKDEYGIEPAAGGAVMMAGPAYADKDSSVSDGPDFNEYDVLVASIGTDKFGLIREVRNQLGVGLKKAKYLVESNSRVLAERVSQIRGDELKWRFAQSGAKIVLVPSALRKPVEVTKPLSGLEEPGRLWLYIRFLWLSQPVAFSVAFGLLLLAVTLSTTAFWVGLTLPILFQKLAFKDRH